MMGTITYAKDAIAPEVQLSHGAFRTEISVFFGRRSNIRGPIRLQKQMAAST